MDETAKTNDHEIDLDKLVPQKHVDIYQEGPYIKCRCHGHGFYIGPGKTLTKVGKKLVLTKTLVLK